jgi:hypothetical protein
LRFTIAIQDDYCGTGLCLARLPAKLAELQCRWESWLQFAFEAGPRGADERAALANGRAHAKDRRSHCKFGRM